MDAGLGPGLECEPLHAHLTELRLDKNPLGDEGVAALAAAPYLRRLKELWLRETGLTAFGLRALAAADGPHLEVLNLEGQWLGSDAAQVLAASPWLKRLRHLDLTACSLGETGLRAVASSPHLHPGMRIGTGRNGVEGGQWRQYEDWSGLGGSEGYEDVSARPDGWGRRASSFRVDIYRSTQTGCAGFNVHLAPATRSCWRSSLGRRAGRRQAE